MVEYRDTEYSLSGRANVCAERVEFDARFSEHVIRTRYGLVYVYRQWHPRLDMVEMEIVVDGRIFQRTWRTIFADRYLVTLAKRFAHDAVCSAIPSGY
jgi:hypothetical protein